MDKIVNRPEIQGYFHLRFEQAVKLGVEDAYIKHPRVSKNTNSLFSCSCEACDIAVARTIRETTYQKAIHVLKLRNYKQMILDAEEWEHILIAVANKVVNLLDSRVWLQPVRKMFPSLGGYNLDPSQVHELISTGLVIITDWLSPGEAQVALGREMCHLASSGYLEATPQKAGGVRGDEIGWLTSEEASHHAGATTSSVISKLQACPPTMLSHLQAPLHVPVRAMATHYPGGGSGYIAHFDNDGADDHTANRAITFVLYANPDWEEEHGGLLRCRVPIHDQPLASHPQEQDRQNESYSFRTVDVEPRAGTLIAFDSRSIQHEVLPSYVSRFALTMWVEDAPRIAHDNG
eukprot:CAMPEP_0196585248 /NCGR_PEP_ID=MMETSP1081-20130531/49990_1 /TAXON_ID=36882 /ORGANISM="Pyramimonas amylifera, Strain CCMP720" /LENGTH=347 /DNA_ID=CAMNT_0041906731 /DNA_START=71 /DNA_END=1110 /DNA_ORIENTATION=+